MIDVKYDIECRDCVYMNLKSYAQSRWQNNYNPRGLCYCEHPKAVERFEKMFPKSRKTPAFIGYTKPGEKVPKLKTHPKWCPQID